MLQLRKNVHFFVQKMFNKNFLKGSFFKKSLAVILLGAYLPTLAVGIISYFIATERIKSEINRTHLLQLQQTYNSIDNQVMNLHVLNAQASFNPTFTDLKGKNLSTDIDRLNEIFASLGVIQTSSNLLYRVSLYSETALEDVEISVDKGLRYLTKKGEGPYKELLSRPERNFWVESSFLGVNKAASSICLVQKIQNSGGYAYGLLILYLDTGKINQIIRQSSPDHEEVALILGEQGQLLSSAKTGTQGKNSLEELVSSQINDRNSLSGNFSFRNNKEDYLVTYETLSRNGWKFAVATPLSRMMAPVELTSKLVILSCLIVMLITIIISFKASGTIYKPIQTLMSILNEEFPLTKPRRGLDEIKLIQESWKDMSRERRLLQTKLEQNMNFSKKSFLMQFLQGHLYFMKEDELKSQFKQYWWEPKNKIFSTLVVRINDFSDSTGDFQKDDSRLVTFAAENIIQEMLKERATESAVVNFHDLTISAIIAFPTELANSDVKSRLVDYSNEIIKTLTTFLNFHVTVVVGQTTTELHETVRASQEAHQALRLRFINKSTQVIDMDSLSIQKDSQISYPFAVEKRILDVLVSGTKDEVTKEIHRFIKKLHTISATEVFVKQSLMQLLGSMLHLFLKTGVNPESLFSGRDFYAELAQIQEIKNVPEWFEQQVIIPYMNELEKLRDCALGDEDCVKKTIEYMEAEYNKAISLELCADRVDMTPKNLSIKFKEYMGVNFIDYLTKLRLDKAKELLSNSELSVNEVAEAVGYEPKYFMRIFKKLEGVTAGSFREVIVNAEGRSQRAEARSQ